jgi:hypothetical protein
MGVSSGIYSWMGNEFFFLDLYLFEFVGKVIYRRFIDMHV